VSVRSLCVCVAVPRERYDVVFVLVGSHRQGRCVRRSIANTTCNHQPIITTYNFYREHHYHYHYHFFFNLIDPSHHR